MARWLRDAETGELFREDELDAGSYEQITDFQDVRPAEPNAGFFDYLSGVGKRAIGGLSEVSGGLELLKGDLYQGIEDYTGLPLGNLADFAKAQGAGLRDYGQELNQEVDQSLPEGLGKRVVDIFGGALPAVASLPLGPMAAATTIGLQSTGRKYGQVTDPENPDRVEGLPAAASAFGSGIVDGGTAAIPLSFIGTSTGPLLRRWLLESAKVGAGNAALAPAQVLGNAAVDAMTLGESPDAQSLGAQTRRSMEDSLISSPLWGLMGATAGRRGPAPDTQVVDGQDINSLMSRMEQSVPEGDSQQAARAFNEYASDPFQKFLSMPEPFAGGDTMIPDSMVRTVRGKAVQEADPLANITPDKQPLIQLEEGSRARSEEEIGKAREVLDVITPWQSDNTRQRRLEDIFMPVDSELAGFRQSLPEGTLAPSEGQGSPIIKPFTQKGAINKTLPADEQNVVRAVLEAEPTRKARAEQAEILAQREEARANNKGSVIGRGDELLIKSPEGTKSFPDPVRLITTEPEATNPAAIQLEEGFRARTPEQINEAQQTLRDSSWEVFKREDGRPEQGPIVAPKEQVPLFDPVVEQSVATVKPEGTAPDDLRNALGKRAATRKAKKPSEQSAPQDVRSLESEYSAASGAYDRLLTEHAKQIVDVVEPLQAQARKLESVIFDLRVAAKEGRVKGPRKLGFVNKDKLFKNPAEEMDAAYKNSVYSLAQLRTRIENETAKATELLAQRDTARETLTKLSEQLKQRPKVKGITSKEAGFVDLTDLVEFFRKRRTRKEAQNFPEYKDWSDSNKRYADGSWGHRWEWMDTTKRKEPASAPFIDSQWRIPQDTHAIVWDADETLAPYKSPELTPKEKQGVNNYLQAARILGSKDKGYKVSAETASAAGLNPKQVEAALSVKRWSDFYADIFENDSLAQAEHYAAIETLKAPNDQYKAAIAKRLEETKTTIAETFKQWRDSNYVPFDRHGEHYVNVFAPDGTLLAREQFESKDDPGFKKAIADYQQLAKQPGDFAGATVKPGRQDPRQLLQDFEVNQDILDILGADGSGQPIAGFSRHFKNAKLIPGYNRDLDRAITDYTVGAARLLAFRRANRVAEMELATTLAGDDKINLRNKLIEFKDSLNNPRGEGAKLLNEYFNFAFIGGNARVAVADTLGFFQMQPMVLSKYLKGFDTEKVELKTYSNLLGYYFGRKLDDGMSAGIKEAQRKGLIPTETFKSYLRARRGPSDTMKAMTTVKDAYFSLKALSERTVDAGAFMSGWEAWRRLPANVKKTVSQQQFAENMIREMKAVPSQMELPPNALFKTETGRLVSKFRLYQVKLAKTIAETPMPGKLRGAMRMFLTVGLAGLPLVKEAFNFSRVAGVEPEDKLREAGYGSATMYGPLSAATGVDWSGTAGYGEVFSSQAENPFTKFTLGMLGAPAEAGLRAAQYLDRGQTRKAVASLPISNLLSNYLNQADWGERGVVTMGGQAVIPRDEVQGIDRLKKLAGFQPLRVKEAMVKENRIKQAEAKAKDTDFINQRIGEAVGLGDFSEALALRQEARAKGIKVNENSVKDYARKIRGIRVKTPKKAKQEVMKVEDLYD